MPLNLTAGDPNLLGANVVDGGVNFALYSHNATRVELVLFDGAGQTEIGRCDLPARDGDIWHGFAAGLSAGHAYGYRVHGPYSPGEGHFYNPHKLLLDPYAKEMVGSFVWDPSHFAYVMESGDPKGAPDTRDNTPFLNKGLIHDPARFTPLTRKPNRPMRDSIIYEMHAKGFTIANPEIDADMRGKIAGLGQAAALDYLSALGITALELLPIHAILQDKFLVDRGLTNFWGYNTLNYFCPHDGYGQGDVIAEMRDFVNAAHDRNLEVVLDVVYNHCCEGGAGGPNLSFRGIDNAAYYWLDPKDKSRYHDISGCGATLNADNPHFRNLVRDSLAHWVSAYGIDGFRFDIATSLGMDRPGQFHTNAPFFKELAADTRLRDVKLISEPWDAAGGHYVGQFPVPWADWNDRARDAYRRFWRGDAGQARHLATAIAGSAPLFRARGKDVTASVNYVACHDGFPLHDLTRYAHKHNEANGENNRDGADENYSCNHGVEGETDDPTILAKRERHAANMLASMFLSFGTPMLLAGDEFGRTQGGSNNAYAQDNAVSWLDWSVANSTVGAQRIAFTKRLIALRRQMFSELPDGPPNGPSEQEPSLAWWSVWGCLMTHADWMSPDTQCFGALLEPGGWLIVANASLEDCAFVLPPAGRGPPQGDGFWQLMLTTADPTRPAGESVAVSGQAFQIEANSLAVFQIKSNRAKGKNGHGF
ncbi:MAG: glycogen debranching protein GlgX [Pseudomonadota bacterium]|jgi:glycogen operon protein